MSAEFNHPSAATRPSRSPLTWHTFWWRYGVLLASLLLTLPSCSSSNKAEQVEQTRAAVATIAFVQVNSTDPQSPQASLVLPYNSAQGAGNLNVVIVGWNDTISSISSVTDTRGNVYQLAVGPTVRAGFATQAIYYAKNIAAGSNSVNVVFDRAADYVDLRILEYTGIDPTTALDVTASATGSSATANSGAVTTTNANDLIVGANMVSTWTSAPGTGFSPRVVTNPDGDIAEDRIVSAVGSYSATATLGSPGDWIMQLAAFRAAGSPADTQAPTAPANLVATAASATQINLTWSAATDNVGVTSYLIERCAGAGCSNFAQVATSASTSFSNTGLTASTSYSYRVRASDAATNLSSYSNTSNATTSAAPDTQAPSAPANLSASSVSVSQINLTWSAATDNVAVTNYLIERCAGAGCSNFAQIATSTSTSFSNTGLTASTSYSYRVRATDAANNLGSYSNAASATTATPPDTQAPSAPTSLAASSVSVSQINLTWTAATDNVGVTSYLIERCAGVSCSNFAQIATATSTSFSNTGLSASTSYSYRVRASDAANNLGGYSNTASATTATPPDTQAPSAPSNLLANVSSISQIDLTWTAATDNVGVTGYLIERCVGIGCSNFTQVGTTSSASFSNTGLSASTSYSYRVRATDAAGNLGLYSNAVVAFTPAPPDTQPPSAPTNLLANASSISQIDLTWTAATDNVGVASYSIERCLGAGCSNFAQIASTTSTTFSNSGLTAGTSYSYRVRASDGAGNLGAYSDTATTTTLTPPDTQAPSAPANLLASSISISQIDLTWSAATDNVGVTSYLIERCVGIGCSNFTQVATTSSTSFSNTGLSASTSYGYRVRATDAAGNFSLYSNAVVAFTSPLPDTQPPSAPANLLANASSISQVDLTWTAATDDVAVVSYLIERCTGAGCSNYTQIASTTATTFSDTGLSSGSAYGYRVRASDAAGNLGAYSNTAATTTPVPPDTQAPSAPANLLASSISVSQIDLTWSAATDNVGVTSYLIERCVGIGCSNFTQVATTSSTSFSNTGLSASTSYGYRVRATDAAGNFSLYSNAVVAFTPAPPDTQPPSAPANLSATTVSGAQINLSWSAATDNVGVTNYLIERCTGTSCANFLQIATGAGTTFSDTGLSAGVGYSYRVRATDAAGNLSGYSNTASATTTPPPDTQAPTAPANVAVTVVSNSQLNLSWTASTDNVGVTAYLVERCQGAGCSNFTQTTTTTGTSSSDTTLQAATSYSYRVRATDAAGNRSSYSVVASGVTSSGAPANPTFVQGTYADPQVPSSLVTVRFAGAQSAGDLNVVAVGWNDTTAQVTNVSDSSGNVYTLAVGPTVRAGFGSQSIYYAKNIAAAAANTNTVSVTFSPAADYPDVRIAQYHGIDPVNPLDVVAVGQGAGSNAVTSAVTTTNSVDLLVGANMVSTITTSAGTGFTSRMISDPDSDILEDRVVTAAGSYSASSSLLSGSWIMQLVAFRGAGSPPPPPDTTPPSAPSSLLASAASTTQINLSFTAATDNIQVTGYLVESCTGASCSNFTQIATSTTTSLNVTGLSIGTSYSYRVRATDAAGNLGPYSNTASATTLAPDTQPPSAPANLVANASSASQVDLSWSAASDNVAVTGYLVESCAGAGCANFTQVASTTALTWSNAGLSSGQSYSYRVRATDAAGNLGAYSGTASATTPAPDTQAPSAPSTLAATTVSGTQIALTWGASTDDVAVTGYLLERCTITTGYSCSAYAQIATTTGLSYTDGGLTPGGKYRYRVRATDGAGNLSAYSNTSTATTTAPDAVAPSAPANLTATLVSNGEIDLSWGAATDNVGVTAYMIERCQGLNCTNFAYTTAAMTTTSSDTTLSAGTSYSYRVQATDAAGNLSAYSNVATAATPGVAANPAYVQGNYADPQGPSSMVSVAYTQAQLTGDLNVVAIGWNDTSATINSVSDTKGNVYTLAVGPTIVAGIGSHAIYYAKNVASASAGSNTVSVAFTPAAAYPDVRIAEYSGLDSSNPLDVVATGQGNSALSSTSSVLTSSTTDLLVAANLVTTTTSGPGAGFTQRMITVPNADILEDRVVNSAGSYNATAPVALGGWIMQMVAFRAGAPVPVDTTPPSVALTSPAAGATLSGVVTVSVTANDNESGIQSVQLLVDGNPIGVPSTSSPYSFLLDTATFGNGAHTLGASALNGAQLVGSATSVSVTLSNSSSADPAVVGQWSGAVPMPLVSVHQTLLSNGKILMSDGQIWGPDARVWDYTTDTYTAVPAPVNIFCGAHDQMPDGRILVVGGHITAHMGLTAANIFNPNTQSWTVAPDMATPRWYPTVTGLPDGRQLVTSGESNCEACFVNIQEIFNPATNSWTRLTSAPFTFAYYPHVFVLPNGRVIVTSTTEHPMVSQVLDLNALTWTAIGGPEVDGGSAAMYLPGKFLKTGTSCDPDAPLRNTATTAYVLDANQSSPTWRQVASMQYPRTFHVETILPDGNVLVTGGGPTTAALDVANGILPAEMWSPTSETFTSMAAMHVPRLYHATALLLPDGRVVVGGGGRFDNATLPTDQFTAEFYSPPYLFKGPRPVISSAPSTLQYGQSFSVQTPDAARIASVSLIRFGSTTHQINMAQRFLPLTFTASSSALTVTAPANSNLAIPGYYMLFIVDTNGVPSVAATVHF